LNAERCKEIDISTFTECDSVFINTEIALVVKSQNQRERRANMLASLKDGSFGRVELRDISTGLLVRGRLGSNGFHEHWRREYREPRHMKKYGDNYLLTEVNRVIELNADFSERNSLTHPFFAFLHTVDVSADASRILVTSSGYDRVIEFESTPSGFAERWHWTGWQHGFNPDPKGFWITDDKEEMQQYLEQGKAVRFVDPHEHGEQGLLTAERTVHSNVAIYNPYDQEHSMIVSCGAPGDLYKVHFATGETTLICESLHKMPHGLTPYDGGWSIADTTVGKLVVFNQQFEKRVEYSLRNVPGKPAVVGAAEWIQQCLPVPGGFIVVDANRGLLAINIETHEYSVYDVDGEWCIQDILCIS